MRWLGFNYDLICRHRQKLRRSKKKAGAVPANQGEGAPSSQPSDQEPLPISATANLNLLGVTSEAFADALADYVGGNPDGLLFDKVRPPHGISTSPTLAVAKRTVLCSLPRCTPNLDLYPSIRMLIVCWLE